MDVEALLAPGLEAVLVGVGVVAHDSQGLDAEFVGLEEGLMDPLGLVDLAPSHCHQTV